MSREHDAGERAGALDPDPGADLDALAARALRIDRGACQALAAVLEGGPLGGERLVLADGVTAALTRARGISGVLNQVFVEQADRDPGSAARTLAALDVALARYAALGARPTVSISPHAVGPEVIEGLARRGLALAWCQTQLLVGGERLGRATPAPAPGVAAPGPAPGPAPAPGVEVLEVDARLWPQVIDGCAVAARDAFGAASAERGAALLDALSGLASAADWRCLAARVDGQICAFALLHLSPAGACLAAAGTAPWARRRGCHGALLRARLSLARAAGCALAISQTEASSASQRNMTRVGLRPIYTKAMLQPLREPPAPPTASAAR